MSGVRVAFRRAMVACILNVVVGIEKLDWLDLKFASWLWNDRENDMDREETD
jgi:hypothetical protein